MDFLDEDDDFAAEEQVSSRRYGAPQQQRQYMVRRLVAAGFVVLVIILMVLGIRGCLDARKERSFENYARDLISVIQQSNQLSERFFQRLEDPGNLSPVDFEAQISADRNTAEGILERVRSLDTPDEMAAAQDDLERAFELRRDGIAGIAAEIQSALSKDPREAIATIANYMQYFLASDVLYGIARGAIKSELKAEDVEAAKIPDSRFLPSVNPWLDDDALQGILAGVASGSAECNDDRLHGLGLDASAINGVALVAGGSATIGGSAPFTLEATVSNQGDADESDVPVSYSIDGGSEDETEIGRIAAGTTEVAELEIRNPPSGEPVTIEVDAGPVPCEELTDNNSASYTVTFP